MGSLVERETSLAFSADSLATVRIVPSVGFITDLYAPSTPASSAATMFSSVSCACPFKALEKPLKIRERITPELPLAPRSSAEAAVFATTPASTSSGRFLSSATLLPMVIDIFVPVSPSGTGKTLSSSTDFFWLEMLLAALISASRSTLPFITGSSSYTMLCPELFNQQVHQQTR